MDFYIDPLARWLGSPNYWYDRNGHSPMWTGPGVDGSWTVLHITDCTEDQATGTFESAAAQRSAHYQIPLRAQLDCSDPDPRKWHPVPGTYDQYVDEGNASWSTGNGDMNDNSDDIEHERTQAMLDGHAPFPPGQLLVSMWKVKDLAERRNRPLTREYVIGHGECKAVEATVFGFGRGTTATGCPDDLPVDLILKGAQMLAAGQDPRGLVGALPSVSGTVDDLVYGVSIPGRVYQGGQLFVWSAGVKKGDSVTLKAGASLPVGATPSYTDSILVGGKWYDLLAGTSPAQAICDDDLDTSDSTHDANHSSPADFRPAPPVAVTPPVIVATPPVIVTPAVVDTPPVTLPTVQLPVLPTAEASPAQVNWFVSLIIAILKGLAGHLAA